MRLMPAHIWSQSKFDNIIGVGVVRPSEAHGEVQVFARSSKFSLFDPAKEMVFIEMSKEEKSKGKAAVDLVGSQIGKSGASWITQVGILQRTAT